MLLKDLTFLGVESWDEDSSNDELFSDVIPPVFSDDALRSRVVEVKFSG